MDFSIKMFLEFPGILILVGVVLLIVAFIMSKIAKKKSGNSLKNVEETNETTVNDIATEIKSQEVIPDDNFLDQEVVNTTKEETDGVETL